MKLNTKLGRFLTGLFIASYMTCATACGVITQNITENKPLIENPPRKTYALLFGGGTYEGDDYPAFYRGIKLMHDTFTKQKAENIEVLYTGNQPDTAKIVQADATEENIKKKLKGFSEKLKEEDTLFIYVATHGFVTWGDDGRQPSQSTILLHGYGATKDKYQKDKFITKDELKDWLKDIKGKKIVLLQSCHGGGFTEMTDDLTKTIVLASSEKSKVSSKWGPRKYIDLAQYVAAAISGELEGKSVNADANEDNLISVKETFDFAKNNMPSSIIGFVTTLPKYKTYRTAKEKPIIKYSKDIDPSKVIIGNYAHKDKSLSPDKTLDLRQKVLKLIRHTIENGEYVGEDLRLGSFYTLKKGNLIFDVYGRFSMWKSKNMENFVPLKMGISHNLELDPVTKKVIKQKVFIDGRQVPDGKGKFPFEGCDGIPDVYLDAEKYRYDDGELITTSKDIPVDDKVIKEYMSLVNELLP